jgi:hypothetical protein
MVLCRDGGWVSVQADVVARGWEKQADRRLQHAERGQRGAAALWWKSASRVTAAPLRCSAAGVPSRAPEAAAPAQRAAAAAQQVGAACAERASRRSRLAGGQGSHIGLDLLDLRRITYASGVLEAPVAVAAIAFVHCVGADALISW